MKTPITVAYGDGIGPEIMEASLHILREGGAQLELERIEIGEKVYLGGNSAGIEPSAWESLRRTKIFYKAPITTPQGGGFKSLNVTTRKRLGLYANVRPCVSYAPFVDTKHPEMDVVIVRENEEDTYGGIEYQLSPEVTECLKLITRPGSEKIVRFAFEYAKANNRKKVTCFTKDNIMKMTDGLFHKVFDEIATEYPDLQSEHWIVDIGAAKLADTPQAFDVVVMPNLYGDILSDVAAQIAGSVGLAGSANIGLQCSMFEAIHGSAPRRAGQNLANPSGLLLGGVMMLVHLGQIEAADRVHNAWLKTLEDGVHTYDIYKEGVSKEKVGTQEFAQAVVARMGQKPEKLKPAAYATEVVKRKEWTRSTLPNPKVELVGVDIYVGSSERSGKKFGDAMQTATHGDLELTMVSNRGVSVWPEFMEETFTADYFRCRFTTKDSKNGMVNHGQILKLMEQVNAAGFDIVKIETLRNFDGKPGYSLAQGQ
ncbi:NADP-dependent isocitrate dehydrogenase [Nevskia soli]|jgi:isocitrate dehydrogenase|uniref:NADP-dependent isocitrate dehydrogenase n=1 Tax=Nevskia soli TaxID=418856 RepID=UPI0015D72071|nr:NADP-dependent isocitrate dehydrogenase [Nevskia soli]